MDVSQVDRIRRFNRAVTQRIGALDDAFLSRSRPLGQARLLWEIGPAGSEVTWDAEVLRDEVNRLIEWRTLAGADVASHGFVQFIPRRDGRGTLVRQRSIWENFAKAINRVAGIKHA